MNVFRTRDLKKPGIFHRLFQKEPKVNFLIEFENRLAAREDHITDVSFPFLGDLENKYQWTMEKTPLSERKEIFRALVKKYIQDRELSENELHGLEHLQQLLSLSQTDYQILLNKETEFFLSRAMDEALVDNKLLEFEKRNLEALRRQLAYPEDKFLALYKEKSSRILNNFLAEAVSDQRLSPEEERELYQIAKNMGIENLHFEEATQEMLDRYRLYWQIENGEIPTLKPTIHLHKNESLLFKTDINWHERRKETRRIRYGGPTLRLKIAKGLYYRAGDLGFQKVTSEDFQLIDSGTLYLTDKRLIFMGGRSNKTLRITRILAFEPFENGISLQKDKGRNPFFEFTTGTDIFSLILKRLLSES
ncbi:MAG TPA: hypothetical protein ENN72_06640 [Firmicutes bacterium]|nr:hypothetical protein [Bacillota bacterium]